MALVRIVTDGGADLPPELADSLGIRIVRGGIHFGEEPWQGNTEEFWRTARSGRSAPSTSPPTAERLTEAFAGTEPVCAIHVSAELSRTEDHAKQAARGLPDDLAIDRVTARQAPHTRPHRG